jgi:hypothetical protein
MGVPFIVMDLVVEIDIVVPALRRNTVGDYRGWLGSLLSAVGSEVLG